MEGGRALVPFGSARHKAGHSEHCSHISGRMLQAARVTEEVKSKVAGVAPKAGCGLEMLKAGQCSGLE